MDNPVSVLTQEMSKQFLQSKNEGDKYKVRNTEGNMNLSKRNTFIDKAYIPNITLAHINIEVFFF